ncbi:MAG: YraN family protein [Patescibacteria group bacterium]|nr:YraN family protein [Patescibacteria group bacterium]
MAWLGSILGSKGERTAEKFLKRKGYRMVARNFRTRAGEVDLICRDGDCLVFVEVKTRTAGGLGFPEDAVGAGKQQRIGRAMAEYLTRLHSPPPAYRLDVVSIEKFEDGQEKITHFENVTA